MSFLRSITQPNITLAVHLPVNYIIERDRFPTGIKIYLVFKLVGKIYCLQVVQQLFRKKMKELSTEYQSNYIKDKTPNTILT